MHNPETAQQVGQQNGLIDRWQRAVVNNDDLVRCAGLTFDTADGPGEGFWSIVVVTTTEIAVLFMVVIVDRSFL